jgi:hypothetical protein
MTTGRLRRLIGLLLAALILISVFVMAATTVAAERKVQQRADTNCVSEGNSSTYFFEGLG